MNKYQTPERPDPRVCNTYVEAALDAFRQVSETGQGQIIFMTGADGSGYPDTLRAVDDQLRQELGFVYHSKRVYGFTFQNGYLNPWRVVDKPAWMNLIGTLFPIIQAVTPTPFLSSFTTLVAILLQGSASAQNMAKEEAAHRQPKGKISLEESFDIFQLNNLVSRASQEGKYPLVWLIDGLDQAQDQTWYDWLLASRNELLANHKILLIVTLDDGPVNLPPFNPRSEESQENSLKGLLNVAQHLCNSADSTAIGQWWYLDRMALAEVTQWVGFADPKIAQVLHAMTDGDPASVEGLWQMWTHTKGHWTDPAYNQLWAVEMDPTSYEWRFRPEVHPDQLPNLQQMVRQHLRQLWDAEEEDVQPEDVEECLGWLALAAQEGETFTAAALAHIYGIELDSLYEFLDEVLAIRDHANSLLIQKETAIEIHDPERGGVVALFQYTFRFEFVWRTLRQIYWSNQEQLATNKERLHQLACTLDDLYHPRQADIAHTLIRLYTASGDTEQARHHQNVSSTLARKVGLRSLALGLLQQDRQFWDDTGWYLAMQLWFDAAEEMQDYSPYEETLAICQATHEAALHLQLRFSKVRALHAMGQALYRMGRFKDALSYYQESLPIIQDMGNQANEAATLTNIGVIYSSLREKEKALCYLQKSLPTLKDVGDQVNEVVTLNSIGMIYSGQGKKEIALSYFQESLPIIRGMGHRAGEANTLTNIGTIYSDLGKKEMALSYHQDALSIIQELGNRGGEAAILNNIGMVYSDLGEKEKALLYYEETLPILRDMGDHWHECVVYADISKVHLAQGQRAPAEAYARQAVQIAQELGHPDLAEYEALLAEVEAG